MLSLNTDSEFIKRIEHVTDADVANGLAAGILDRIGQAYPSFDLNPEIDNDDFPGTTDETYDSVCYENILPIITPALLKQFIRERVLMQ